MAAADGLGLYLSALDGGRLRDDEDARIVCEHHEDWAVVSRTTPSLSLPNTANPRRVFSTLNQLADAGGLAHLFCRWHVLGEMPSCRLVTTAGLARRSLRAWRKLLVSSGTGDWWRGSCCLQRTRAGHHGFCSGTSTIRKSLCRTRGRPRGRGIRNCRVRIIRPGQPLPLVADHRARTAIAAARRLCGTRHVLRPGSERSRPEGPLASTGVGGCPRACSGSACGPGAVPRGALPGVLSYRPGTRRRASASASWPPG